MKKIILIMMLLLIPTVYAYEYTVIGETTTINNYPVFQTYYSPDNLTFNHLTYYNYNKSIPSTYQQYLDYVDNETQRFIQDYIDELNKPIEFILIEENIEATNIRAANIVEADLFLDHTDAYPIKNSTRNIEDVLSIQDKEDKIDHDTYPSALITDDKRDIGKTVTWLIEIFKGLIPRIEQNQQSIKQLQQENQALKTELCKKDRTYSWC